MEKKLRIIKAAGIGSITGIVFITLATILAELFSPFKEFLKENFSHHWVGKGILAFLIFLAVSFLVYFLSRKDELDKTAKILVILGWVSVFSSLAIFSFYIYEFFK